jgi:hypothetical protein
MSQLHMVIWTLLPGDFGDARTVSMLCDVASRDTLVTHGMKATGAAVASAIPQRSATFYVSEKYAGFQLDCYIITA